MSGGTGVIDIEHVKFILARVLHEVATVRSPLPLLVEREPLAETCPKGHRDWRIRPNGTRECRACARDGQRERRKRGRGV